MVKSSDKQKVIAGRLLGYASNPENMQKDAAYPFYLAGVEKGKSETERKVLDFLEHLYMVDPRPERESNEAKAILEVTKLVAAHLRTLTVEQLTNGQ